RSRCSGLDTRRWYERNLDSAVRRKSVAAAGDEIEPARGERRDFAAHDGGRPSIQARWIVERAKELGWICAEPLRDVLLQLTLGFRGGHATAHPARWIRRVPWYRPRPIIRISPQFHWAQ